MGCGANRVHVVHGFDATEADVLAQGGRKLDEVLEHDAHDPTQRGHVELAHVDSVDEDPTLGRLIEA
ncbi:MAG: hypothetical protein ABI672_17730, partial [Vicinamibacteria bacterium]